MEIPKFSDITVIKKDGRKEPFFPEKIHRHLEGAVKDIPNVSISDILHGLHLKLTGEMRSRDIQKMLIASTHDLISVYTPGYAIVAARLLNQDLRDIVYGQYQPLFNAKVIKERIEKGLYHPVLLKYYSDEELDYFVSLIDWERDDLFKYMGLQHTITKYLNKKDGEPIETPQEIFMLIPLYIFGEAYQNAKQLRQRLVKGFYNALSRFELILPTPAMVGIRTRMRGYTSCAGLNLGDSIPSLGNALKDQLTLTTKLRAGIGTNAGYIRGVGADIGNGKEVHTGIVPFAKDYEVVSKSSQQPNSSRGGAVTFYYPFFHYEIENLLVLKNSRGEEHSRVRHSDHAFVFNSLFYERLAKGEDITLFHMNEVPLLYDYIGVPERFKELYEHYEKTVPEKHKRRISAKTIYDTFWNERMGTGRIYKINAEAFQGHSAFNLPVNFSNLCTEINLPAFPNEDLHFNGNFYSQEEVDNFFEEAYEGGYWYPIYEYLKSGILPTKESGLYPENVRIKALQKIFEYNIERDEKGSFQYNFGEIFSCILGGINMAVDIGRLPELMELMVRFLDALIDSQEYSGVWAFERSAKGRRTLGISVSNMFYALAKKGLKYSTKPARDFVARYFENMLFYGIKASVELAKEKGKCAFFADTKYAQGIFPIDTYERNVDELVSKELFIPKEVWDALKEEVKRHGMRNSTLLTVVPASNSSRVSGAISGINPPQNLVYVVEDKKLNLRTTLPEVEKYKEEYRESLAWKLDMVQYLKLVGTIQKYVDQAISLNFYYDLREEDAKIPFTQLIKEDITAMKYGIKTYYYAKSVTVEHSQESIEENESTCSGGGCEL